jgi:hypothetical protein
MEQLELLPGVTARDAAIAQVAQGASVEWLQEAMDTVISMAIRLDTFTTDEVWAQLETTDVWTHEPRAMGAIMVAAQRDGWVVATDQWRTSRRRRCHSRPLRVWQSLVAQ